MLGFDYVCLYLVIPVCALCCAAVWWLFGIVLWVYSACYLISLRLPVLVYTICVCLGIRGVAGLDSTCAGFWLGITLIWLM